jgi:hypothetical protein
MRGILLFLFRKKFYMLHYMMWDYIARQLEKAKPDDLLKPFYIDNLKKSFIDANSKGQKIVFLCYLCALHDVKCTDCPLYKKYGNMCASSFSYYRLVKNTDCSKKQRIEAARKIRDCVGGEI